MIAPNEPQQMTGAALGSSAYNPVPADPASERGSSAKEGDGMTAVQRVVADLKVLCAAWGDNR